jgi:hypothetical protein
MPQKHKDAIEIFMERFLMVRRLGGMHARWIPYTELVVIDITVLKKDFLSPRDLG